jgi:hypothetical protein
MDPKPSHRGRPATGTALSGAERQRRYRERQSQRIAVTHPPRDEKPRRGNPDHQRLFAIPETPPSPCTDLAIRRLPEARRVTGDAEVDAVLWLADVCKTAQDLRVLDLALEAAQRIRRPVAEIEQRYADWLRRQPGVSPLQVAFGSFGVANVVKKVEHARARLIGNTAGLAIFGTFQAAMEPTPAERMLETTAGAWPEGGGRLEPDGRARRRAVRGVGESRHPRRRGGRAALLALAVAGPRSHARHRRAWKPQLGRR